MLCIIAESHHVCIGDAPYYHLKLSFWIYSTSLSFFFSLFLITFSVYAKNSLQEDLGGAMFAVYVSMLVCM